MVALYVLVVIYAGLILAFAIGYYRAINMGAPQKASKGVQQHISIVVAARNEEQSICRLLQTIAKQSYPSSLFEVIIVDDHSYDKTLQAAESWKQQLPNLSTFSLPTNREGKKEALNFGIKNAKWPFIAVTDADCEVPTAWLEQVNKQLEAGAELVCGPTVYNHTTFFEKLSSVEFGSLVASGIGAAGLGLPIYCNAANMCFTKELYLHTHQNHQLVPSGDDVFLLHEAKRRGSHIAFTTGVLNTVKTTADKTISDFINRRIRWGSKSKHYKDISIIATAIIVALGNFALIALLTVSIVSNLHPDTKNQIIALWLIKIAADFSLLSVHFRSTEQKKWFKYFVVLEALYPIYITFTAAASIISSYTWKGRSY